MGFEPGKPTNVKVRAHVRKPPTPKPVQSNPDQREQPSPARGAHRARVQGNVVKVEQRAVARDTANARVRTPDQADRERSPAQRQHDAQVVAQNVASSRRAVVRQQHAGSAGRAVAKAVKQTIHTNAATLPNTGAGPTMPMIGGGHGGGLQFASVQPRAVRADRSTYGGKLALNILPDAAELAVTTPSSVAKLATTAATHPKKVPGMLAAPYLQLYHHPGKFIQEHPVSAALMAAPVVRLPGRAVGRVARVAGKQTLERPAATLPGTALKEARTGSRDVVVRAVQGRKDAKATEPPTMTVKQVQTRVDEHFDAAKQHTQRVIAAATRDAVATAKEDGLSKADTKVAVATKVEGARSGAKTQADVRFAKEFGAVHQVTPSGAIVTPKAATEGALHDTQAAAEKVVARLNRKPVTIPTGKQSPVRLTIHEPDAAGKPVSMGLPHGPATAPLEFTARKVGDKYVVLPKVAAERMYPSGGPDSPLSHMSVGGSKSTGAKVMRRSRGAFTQAVLPFSAKWLAGQGVEAGVRSLVAGAGPFDWLRMHQVVKRLNANSPGSGDALMERVSGGQFGLTGPAREFAQGQKSLAHEFAGTSLKTPAAIATGIAHTAPLRAVRAGFGHYSHFVMGRVNGVFENTARKAMAGQAIKNSPFMEHHIIGLTDKALDDAARGLHATENQVRLGRAVDRMYGKYQKFSPEMRTTLMHWTPFLPWYLNVASFLTKVLPVDHPVTTALLADASAATEEWRKSHDLSLHQANHVPSFLLGSYPKPGGGFYRIAHYTPFGAGPDVVSSTGGLVLPQIVGPLKNMLGIDWKGKRLVDEHGKEFSQGQDAIRALVTAAEEQVPGASQAGALTGVTPRYVDHKKTYPGPGAVLKGMLPTTATSASPVRARVVGKPTLNGAGTAGGGKLNGAGGGGGGKLN